MQQRIRFYAIRLTLLLAGGSYAITGLAQEFPAGEGRELLFFACTQCHGLDHISAPHKKLTAEEWEIYVYDMVAKGANLDKDEMELVKSYLVENFAVKN